VAFVESNQDCRVEWPLAAGREVEAPPENMTSRLSARSVWRSRLSDPEPAHKHALRACSAPLGVGTSSSDHLRDNALATGDARPVSAYRVTHSVGQAAASHARMRIAQRTHPRPFAHIRVAPGPQEERLGSAC
jgi:hypothetical protein